MVDRLKIVELAEERLDDRMFLVDVSVSSSNIINVIVDSFDGLTINECAEINRYLEERLDRDKEDFELCVSSPGLTEPFKVKEQFFKNKGREIKVTRKDGSEVRGVMKDVCHEYILLEVTSAERVKETKKKKLTVSEIKLKYDDIKNAKVVITFK